MTAAPSIEELFTGAGYADVPASRLQHAVLRVADGKPIGKTLKREERERFFGMPEVTVETVITLLVLICGIRSGKSYLVACGAIHDALAADCSRAKPHEIVRHPIAAPSLDAAQATFRILKGIVDNSPVLRPMVVKHKGKKLTTEVLWLRRPDGRVVEICVVAANKAAIAFRSRWLAGATLEEVALFGILEEGSKVTAEELVRASRTRILPNTQLRLVSSPWGPSGALYKYYKRYWGKPSAGVFVVKAPTVDMNPTVDVELIEEARKDDPDAVARENDAEFIDVEGAFYESVVIEAATRTTPETMRAEHGRAYVAAWDAATRGNAWTLVVVRAADEEGEPARVALAREWVGSAKHPLDTEDTIREIADLLAPYSIKIVHADRWSFDALAKEASRAGLELEEHRLTPDETYSAHKSMRDALQARMLELPPTPRLLSDLRSVRKRAVAGSVRIDLPRTTDGRHCDYVPSLLLAYTCAAEGEDKAVHMDEVDQSEVYGDPLDMCGAGADYFENRSIG